MKAKELFEELEKKNRENFNIFFDSLKTHDLNILNVTFEVKLSKELMEHFELNDDIKFYCKVSSEGGEMIYYYKSNEINPDCYYIRPDNYKNVTTLQILQESIKQDTSTPDIKILEVQ